MQAAAARRREETGPRGDEAREEKEATDAEERTADGL